jgi:hypothetical protein
MLDLFYFENFVNSKVDNKCHRSILASHQNILIYFVKKFSSFVKKSMKEIMQLIENTLITYSYN